MEYQTDLLEFLIEKRNELSQELYEFITSQKKEILDYTDASTHRLSQELYEFIASQKREIFDYTDASTQHLNQELYEFIASQKKEILDLLYQQIENMNRHLVDYVKFEVQEKITETVDSQKKTQDFCRIRNFFQQYTDDKLPRFILLGIPEHGNLGDHAITCGERRFFSSNFKGIPLLELSWEAADNNIVYLMDKIQENDLIFIQGGGFLGSLWENEQEKVDWALERFHKNPILTLPQTYWCADDETGKQISKKFETAMKKCEELYVCLREESSFNRFKERFPDIPTLLIPDMALYINTNIKEERDNQVLLCLRNDKEKILKDEQNIVRILDDNGIAFEETTTVIDVHIPYGMDEKYVWDKLAEFARAKFVITDRLHGMIFAVLTGTPCIAINNISGKVEGVYQWIKERKNVFLMKENDDIMNSIMRLSKINDPINFEIERYYKDLVVCMQKIIDR